MFSKRECSILSWAKNGDIHGVTVQTSGDNYQVSKVVEIIFGDGHTVPSNIAEAFNKLSPSGDTPVILTGHIEQGIYIDLLLPKLKSQELNQLLQFELARKIPYQIDDLIWNFRVLKEDKAEDFEKVPVRVFAVPEERWAHLVSDLQLSAIKADLFVPSFMGVTGDEKTFFPTMNSEFSLSPKNSMGLHSFKVSDNTTEESETTEEYTPSSNVIYPYNLSKKEYEKYAPAVSCGIMCLKHGVKLDSTTKLHLPKEMKPQRLRSLIFASFIALAFAVTIGCVAVYKLYNTNRTQFTSLKEEMSKVLKSTDRVNKTVVANQEFDKKLNKLSTEYLGESDLINYVAELTEAVPNDMRLSTFSQRDAIIDMTVVAPSNARSESLLNKIKKTGSFEVVSNRKMSRSGSTNFIIKLKIK